MLGAPTLKVAFYAAATKASREMDSPVQVRYVVAMRVTQGPIGTTVLYCR